MGHINSIKGGKRGSPAAQPRSFLIICGGEKETAKKTKKKGDNYHVIPFSWDRRPGKKGPRRGYTSMGQEGGESFLVKRYDGNSFLWKKKGGRASWPRKKKREGALKNEEKPISHSKVVAGEKKTGRRFAPPRQKEGKKEGEKSLREKKTSRQTGTLKKDGGKMRVCTFFWRRKGGEKKRSRGKRGGKARTTQKNESFGGAAHEKKRTLAPQGKQKTNKRTETQRILKKTTQKKKRAREKKNGLREVGR